MSQRLSPRRAAQRRIDQRTARRIARRLVGWQPTPLRRGVNPRPTGLEGRPGAGYSGHPRGATPGPLAQRGGRPSAGRCGASRRPGRQGKRLGGGLACPILWLGLWGIPGPIGDPRAMVSYPWAIHGHPCKRIALAMSMLYTYTRVGRIGDLPVFDLVVNVAISSPKISPDMRIAEMPGKNQHQRATRGAPKTRHLSRKMATVTSLDLRCAACYAVLHGPLISCPGACLGHPLAHRPPPTR